jgi:hypothetical protein
MILNYHGIHLSQEDIVQRTFGSSINSTVNLDQLLQALSGWHFGWNGRRYFSRASFMRPDPDLLASRLPAGPIVAALVTPGGTEHAMVLSGFTYDVDSLGTRIGRSVVLRDPWPANPSRQEISWSEFQSRLISVVSFQLDPM